MALPKKKTAKARQGKRRSHLKLNLPALDICPQCQSPKLAHHVCPTCGSYNDRQAVEVKTPKRKS
ncbi:MAG: 50S ribosomal protein L32 [Dehalococcoidia bacterium]|nr:50S ribosomal protein L32 [Dehalococcoidia bacterium]MDH5781765.1 50S ribosomal protein L32 [Dehalococcoidia bacterium]